MEYYIILSIISTTIRYMRVKRTLITIQLHASDPHQGPDLGHRPSHMQENIVYSYRKTRTPGKAKCTGRTPEDVSSHV